MSTEAEKTDEPEAAPQPDTEQERQEQSLPVRLTPIKLKAPPEYAGGLRSVISLVKYSTRHLGWFKGSKVLRRSNQIDGFDCPGCSWPQADKRSRVEFCENGARAIAHEATPTKIGGQFFDEWSIEQLRGKSDFWLEQQGRIARPMVKKPNSNHYERIRWEDAFLLIGSELRDLESPDDAFFYCSGRTSNEAAFLYQLLARQFGTNNLPSSSNMCHEPSDRALSNTIGVNKGTVSLEDFEHADAIFIVGQNPGSNQPRMLAALEKAVRRGARIVSINPFREAGLLRFKHPRDLLGIFGSGTPLSELFLQVVVNGDVAALKGIAKAVLEEEAKRAGEILDHEFIHQHTVGFDEYDLALQKTNWDEITQACGVSREDIRKAAEIYIGAERTIICWGTGLTQHKNGQANVQELVNLLLLKGNVGRLGSGVCPVGGHSNAQGIRTVGVWEAPRPPFLRRLGEAFDFQAPERHGGSTVQAVKAMHSEEGKVLIGLGGNFLAVTPDTAFVEAAVRNCRMTVHISTKLNRSHLVTGELAFILPCLSRSDLDVTATGEQFLTVENSMSVVHKSRGHKPPVSERLLSEASIIAGIAAQTVGDTAGGPNSGVTWKTLGEDYDVIRDRIELVVPGFDDFNAKIKGPGWLVLPNGARERHFDTGSGKAQFTVHQVPRITREESQFLMMTIRSHDQFNTTIFALGDRYRGISRHRRVVMINPADMEAAHLQKGQSVDLTSHFKGQLRTAKQFIVVPFDTPPGCVATYFPEANPLVPLGSVADGTDTPTSKSIVVSISPSTID